MSFRCEFEDQNEDFLRRVSSDLKISATVIGNIMMEMMLENIDYQTTVKLIKLHINKKVLTQKFTERERVNV